MATTVGGFHYNAPVQLVERSHPAPAILRVRVDRLTMLIAAHARGNSLSKGKLAELWNNLAQDWLDLSQPAQAQAAAGRALWIADEILDEEAAVRALVIQAQAWICSGSYPEALSTLQRAQRFSATNPGIPAQMATLHARLNEWPQAEYAARLALRLDPNRTDCLNVLALAAAESGDVLASIEILNKLLLIDRNCAAALANRARLGLITGDDAQAFADASRAASIEPCVPAHWNNRGIAYARLGHTDAALADFGPRHQPRRPLQPRISQSRNPQLGTRTPTRRHRRHPRRLRTRPRLPRPPRQRRPAPRRPPPPLARHPRLPRTRQLVF